MARGSVCGISTAQRGLFQRGGRVALEMLVNDELDPLFEAVAQVVEAALMNALAAATDMVGRDGHTVYALPHAGVRDLMQRRVQAP